MSRALSNTEEFSNNSQNLIRQLEGSPIPDSFPGATNFDYAVMDTDDSFVVSADLLRGTKAGWKVLVPVNPHDPIGLDRIPREIRAIITTTLLTPSDLKLSVFMNMAHGGDITEGAAKLQNALNTHGINSTLTSVHLPYAPSSSAPILLDQAAYRDSLDSLLREVSR